MYRLMTMALLLLAATGCKKEVTPTAPGTDMLAAGAEKQYTGSFVDGPYGRVTGKAHVVRNSNATVELLLEGLNSSNGPDLHVYLSKEIQPVNFIDLGPLKSVAGNQLYRIQGTVDFSDYKFALVHCQAFNHLFGSALLIKN